MPHESLETCPWCKGTGRVIMSLLGSVCVACRGSGEWIRVERCGTRFTVLATGEEETCLLQRGHVCAHHWEPILNVHVRVTKRRTSIRARRENARREIRS